MTDDYPTISRKTKIAGRVVLSVRQLERLEKAGKFPKRVRLSGNSAGWIDSEVTHWLHERIAASRGEPAAA